VVAPAPLAIATTTLANGVIGTSYNQTIQATGGAAPFAWTVSSGALPHNLSLSASTTSTVTLSGTPDTVAQGVAFTIQVTYPSGDIATQSYTVSILPQADSLVLSVGSLNFGTPQLLGSTSGALAEMLTNTGTSPLAINSIAIAGYNATEFNQTTTCGPTLNAGANCGINVTFTPGQIGPRAATLTVTDDAAGSPQSVPLNGLGLTAGPNATLSVSNLTFGPQLVGTTSPAMSVALNNYGTAALNIVNISATPIPSFAETDDCAPSLASGATCTIKVTFTAGSPGDTVGTLSISDDAPGSPQKVSLIGTGSTNTPLLSGYCQGPGGVRDGPPQCGVAQDSAQCPAGQPSISPGLVAGNCFPDGTMVDGARTCKTQTSGGVPFSGYCLTAPP
jgi:Putative Ig domain